ncbi:MAG: DUF6263 family protein [Bacteroidota bacterium]
MSYSQFTKTQGSLMLLVFFLLFSGFNADKPLKKLDLKLNFKKGQVLAISNVMEQTISQTIMGTDNSFKQNVGMYYTMTVKDIVEGTYSIEVNYSKTTFKTANPAASVDFDSDLNKEDIAPMAMGFAALVGESFTIRMDEKGNVVEVLGMEDFLENVVNNLMEMNPEMGSAMAETMKQQYGGGALSQGMESMTMYFPPKAVKEGDSWERTSKVNMNFEMEISNTFTLDQVKDGKAYISVSSVLNTNKDKEIEMQGMKMKYDLLGTQKGTFIVDVESGWVLESDIDQDIDGNMSLESPQIPNPMDVPMAIESKVQTIWIK